MHQTREDLDIIFRKITPEKVLHNILDSMDGAAVSDNWPDGILFPESYRVYDHFGLQNLRGYSINEVEMRYNALRDQVTDTSDSIFGLLSDYAESVLVYKNNQILCRLEKILDWNSITSRLGQDIFATAWLAKRDCGEKLKERIGYYSFDWPAVLKTDDIKLNAIFEKGLAENHFHLNGSTQSFMLSWTCLMNHPDLIQEMLKYRNQFEWSLNAGVSGSVLDEPVDWKKRLTEAAYIRALLFARCMGDIDSSKMQEKYFSFEILPLLTDVKRIVENLRFTYGVSFEQVKRGTYACLDYAISHEYYKVDVDSHNRLLGGERAFLYQCFIHIMQNEFNYFEQALFYLYLLIKSNFRGELILINGRLGFQNFAEYQDRKNQFFERKKEYWNEAQRLAVCTAIEENNLQSLEVRIMPQTQAGKMASEIKAYDKMVSFASKEYQQKLFFVTHFPKSSGGMRQKSADGFSVQPRNYITRQKIRKQAKAIYFFKKRYNSCSERICGIDACSNEIGCRPETFATEYRFLRYQDMRPEYKWYEVPKKLDYSLKATYHVGEDFLDLCDGLRAIDEAILYLDLQKGDRIGHAIVLGTDPEAYYNLKRRNIYLTKQDFLDDCVWILKRSLEWNVPIESDKRELIKNRANDLLYDIYNSLCCDDEYIMQHEYIWNAYYYSWILRGDHPSCYKTGKYVSHEGIYIDIYDEYLTMGKHYDKYREQKLVSSFLYAYHYDNEVREKGLKIEKIVVEDWFIELMVEFQKQIRKIVAQKGIAIECNPTSNTLIGTFFQYERHPILQFNDHILNADSVKPQINVSINTDDLGVFDTSLSNEYALLLSAIIRKRHRDGNYNDEVVYEYLDYLRQNGLNMAFRKGMNNLCSNESPVQ